MQRIFGAAISMNRLAKTGLNETKQDQEFKWYYGNPKNRFIT
jgi:hypothetical protein